MEKSFLILSVPMLTLINFLHVPSFILGAQADIINIACGATDPFTDSNGNDWVGDDQFIQSGSIGTIQNTSQYSQILSTVRYFSDGNTNCYTIPIVSQANKTKVVAIFLYGNYDDKEQPPSFMLQIDDSNSEQVSTSMDDKLVAYEMSYWPLESNVSVCLAQDETGGVPFISAIQIMEAPPSPPSPSTEFPPPSPSTESPPGPSTEAPPPSPSRDTSSTIIQQINNYNIVVAPAKAPAKAPASANTNASTNGSPKGKFGGFIYLVTLLPGGTLITIVASVIACILKRKKDKKADVNINFNIAGAANQQKSDAGDKRKDEVQGTDN